MPNASSPKHNRPEAVCGWGREGERETTRSAGPGKPLRVRRQRSTEKPQPEGVGMKLGGGPAGGAPTMVAGMDEPKLDADAVTVSALGLVVSLIGE